MFVFIRYDQKAREAEIAMEMKREHELAEEEQRLIEMQKAKEKEIYQTQLESQLVEQVSAILSFLHRHHQLGFNSIA